MATEVQLAIGIIERMQEVVHNDMLIRGDYIDSRNVDEKMKESGSICGGHRVCAIGSLWIGAGIKPQNRRAGWYLPHITTRRDAFDEVPGLELAYTMLNKVSTEHPLWGGVFENNAMEELFEGTKIPPKELLAVVTEQALERLRSMAVTT